MTKSTHRTLFLACAVALSMIATARADDTPAAAPPPSPAAAAPGDAAGDPPARVGRLSYFSGKVMLHPPGDGDWTEAARNYPVTTGETFWADQGAFVEVQIAGAEIRVGGSTELGVVTLDDNRIALGLSEGSANIVVDKLPDGAVVEATMPSSGVVVQIFSVGRYHIDAGTTAAPPRASAFKGLARLVVSGSTLDVKDGEAGIVDGVNPAVLVTKTAEPDDLDKWADARQDDLAAAMKPKPRPTPAGDINPPSGPGNAADAGNPTDGGAPPADGGAPPDTQNGAVYVAEDMPGGAELAQSGEWTTSPDYGQVWYPTDVAVGWAPYRYGHWTFVRPWGWTWIDDAPWGFAPFHYGRWAEIDGRWGWVPGEIVERPVYAPALVSFVGIGAVAEVGVSDAIGWYPLGPREVYVPPYQVSDVYVTHVNIGGFYHDRDGHMNGRFLTSVNQGDFAASHAVQNAALHLPPSALERGGGPLIRDPGLRPHLDPGAVLRPPAHVGERPLAGLARFPSPRPPEGLTHANLALPPPPKNAIRGPVEGPARVGPGLGTNPPHAHEGPIRAGETPPRTPAGPQGNGTKERHAVTNPNGQRPSNGTVREPQVRTPVHPVATPVHPVTNVQREVRPPPQVNRPMPVVNRPPPQVNRPMPVVNRPPPQVNRQMPVVNRPPPQQVRAPVPQVRAPGPPVRAPAPQVKAPPPPQKKNPNQK